MVTKLNLLAKIMSESSKDFSGTAYKLFNALVIIGGIATAYLYLDWGFLQILGAIFLMSMAFEVD